MAGDRLPDYLTNERVASAERTPNTCIEFKLLVLAPVALSAVLNHVARTQPQQTARAHLHIANQRRDFHHKTARKLVTQYGTIVHEKLNIQGIARSRLAKSTHDAGWGQFLTILHSKAEEAACVVIPVPPQQTTQACSECGALPETPKTPKDRVHRYVRCGYEANRDLNAALTIKRLGLSRQALTSSVDGVV